MESYIDLFPRSLSRSHRGPGFLLVRERARLHLSSTISSNIRQPPPSEEPQTAYRRHPAVCHGPIVSSGNEHRSACITNKCLDITGVPAKQAGNNNSLTITFSRNVSHAYGSSLW